MQSKNKTVRIIGSTVLPLGYIVSLLIMRDPDFIIFVLGPFGFPIWLVQWVAFLFGGWILAVIATVLFLSLIGYLLGRLIDFIVGKIRSSRPV